MDQRAFLMSLGGGLCFPMSSGVVSGNGNSPLADAYLEANFEFDVWRPYVGVGFGASVFAAVAPCLGTGLLGGTVRVVQPWDESPTRWTAGLGPTIGSDGSVLAEADVTLEIRSEIGFSMVVGPKLAIALNQAGDGKCGVDTCPLFVPAGSFLLLLRLGFGLNL